MRPCRHDESGEIHCTICRDGIRQAPVRDRAEAAQRAKKRNANLSREERMLRQIDACACTRAKYREQFTCYRCEHDRRLEQAHIIDRWDATVDLLGLDKGSPYAFHGGLGIASINAEVANSRYQCPDQWIYAHDPLLAAMPPRE